MNKPYSLGAIGTAMWALVESHTGRVGYERGIKAAGLDADPPVIDCSGWTALLLCTGMKAANHAAAAELFEDCDMIDVCTWSDRMIEVLERRTGWILRGNELLSHALPPFATIGLQQGGGGWASNHPRRRGITHVVQVVRRPYDGALFISEAQGWAKPYGIRLMPLPIWLDVTQAYFKAGEAWAVNSFANRVRDREFR